MSAAPVAAPTSVSVVVPTWQRAASLERCLRALAAQTRAPDEIIVVTRDDDVDSREAAGAVALPQATRLMLPTTTAQGVVVALQAGLDAATGDLIAFTDDDAEPRVDWIARLVATVAADPKVAGAGGRDLQPGNTERERGTVGHLQWFGRVIGAHHLGTGAAREVDVLKGVNLAMRAAPLRAVGFDPRLRGAGAQLHWELGICLGLRRAGWKLIYDPSIVVDHHVAVREGDDQLHRGTFGSAAMTDAVHNETLLILEHLHPLERVAFLVWEGLVGTVAAPGYLNAVRLRAQGHVWAFDAWRATRRGRKLAFSAFGAARTVAKRRLDA